MPAPVLGIQSFDRQNGSGTLLIKHLARVRDDKSKSLSQLTATMNLHNLWASMPVPVKRMTIAQSPEVAAQNGRLAARTQRDSFDQSISRSAQRRVLDFTRHPSLDFEKDGSRVSRTKPSRKSEGTLVVFFEQWQNCTSPTCQPQPPKTHGINIPKSI